MISHQWFHATHTVRPLSFIPDIFGVLFRISTHRRTSSGLIPLNSCRMFYRTEGVCTYPVPSERVFRCFPYLLLLKLS